MMVYNHTFKVDNSIEEEWINWVKETYEPGIMNTGLFYTVQFFKLTEPVDDTEASTFVLQHFTESIEKYAAFLKLFADEFEKRMLNNWGEKVLGFVTVMQAVK